MLEALDLSVLFDYPPALNEGLALPSRRSPFRFFDN